MNRRPITDSLVVVDTYRRDRRRGYPHRKCVQWAAWTWRELSHYRAELKDGRLLVGVVSEEKWGRDAGTSDPVTTTIGA